MESPSKINDWLHEIAPIGREALESPIDFPVETPPPSPASTGVEVVSFFVPPPSPATTHSELQSPGSDAAIDDSRPEKNVTIPRHHLVPGKDDHRNAIYMKSKFMEFVEGIMMREFPFELWPDSDPHDQTLTFKGSEEMIDLIILRFLYMIVSALSSLNVAIATPS
ncbi:hypothetical protein QFC24_006345 [Naganishia onofrii]|uniref:Uncharacterized protein n=1 Tax=Naganishia onofrii TaxID=1851511 RepID=A0ACC2X214_9TREE|nr:hypothetical protein QFC24_006345 [Naganishia onofrii]